MRISSYIPDPAAAIDVDECIITLTSPHLCVRRDSAHAAVPIIPGRERTWLCPSHDA